jgi:transmembrane sensor
VNGEDVIDLEAIRWHDALGRDDADWDGFTAWLEADPRHRTAFDAVALVDARLTAHHDTLAAILPAEMPAEAAPVPSSRRWWWGGGAGAALAAVAAAALLLVPGAPPPVQTYATGPGQTRAIALADGSRITLAAASRLTVASGDHMRLDGAALFDIPHRPARQLTIAAGGVTVTDIGTRFEITADPAAVRVAVETGHVAVAGPGLAAPVPVGAGRRLVLDRASGTVEQGPLRNFASWRAGRLVYENAPIALVAAEVGRYAGTKVVVAPGLATRRFSGVLTIGTGVVDDLARFLGADVRREQDGIRLVPRPGGDT